VELSAEEETAIRCRSTIRQLIVKNMDYKTKLWSLKDKL